MSVCVCVSECACAGLVVRVESSFFGFLLCARAYENRVYAYDTHNPTLSRVLALTALFDLQTVALRQKN